MNLFIGYTRKLEAIRNSTPFAHKLDFSTVVSVERDQHGTENERTIICFKNGDEFEFYLSRGQHASLVDDVCRFHRNQPTQ